MVKLKPNTHVLPVWHVYNSNALELKQKVPMHLSYNDFLFTSLLNLKNYYPCPSEQF